MPADVTSAIPRAGARRRGSGNGRRGLAALGAALAAALFLGACATTPSAPPNAMASIAASIADLGEDALWVCGNAALQAEDHLRAAMCFSLLADDHPDSPLRRDALIGAGEAWERTGDWERALVRYQAAFDPEKDDAYPLTWKISTALYELARYEEALELLLPLVDREDLSLADRIRSRTWVGICRLEMGLWAEAELDFHRAIFLHRREREAERVDPYFPAQAQFFVGEVHRLRFEAVRIEQTDDREALSETIEEKSHHLLSAQANYARALRYAHPHWATASGQRIGALYERFYDEMLSAPIPSTLTPAQAKLYRQELKDKVRVLIRKAITAYERTLAAAERIGLDTVFVEETKRSLRRMERLLLEDEVEQDVEARASGGTDVVSAMAAAAGDRR